MTLARRGLAALLACWLAAAQPAEGSAIQAAVERAIAEWAAPLGATVARIELPESARRPSPEFAGAEVATRAPAGPPRPGRVVVECELTRADGSRHRVAVPCVVLLSRVVPVAAGRLARHRTLEESDVRWTPMEFSTTGDWPEAIGQIAGRRLRRGLEPGAVIALDLLESVPAVRRGEAVEVTVAGGGLAVRLQTIALEDGQAGEEIRLRNRDSRRVLRAVVTAPGFARVAR